ncbi:chemotaxis protein CheX, partial [Acinetobacter baumannii]|uniref:chemotaxis protein CheX n=1 Tax=Acinetobacter baumannii TaxID=470 RepID=UPI001CF31DED
CVSFDKGSYLEVVSSMLMEEQTELNADNQDAVGEINNIIFGNAKAEISNFGVQMTVPRVLLGSNQVVACAAGSAGMMIPFNTNKGKFYIVVVALPMAK